MVRLNGATFSPGQEAARDVLSSTARHVCLYGGTRSGKTFLIVRAIVHRALRAEESRHAMLRFRANAARMSLSLDTLPNVGRKCFPGVKIVEHRQDGFFELPNKSQIWVGGLDDKDRVEKILGTEFCTIYLNEASQIPYESVLVAKTRLAQQCPDLMQRFIVDLNPVGKQHWTNQMFVQKKDPQSGQPLPDPENYAVARLNPVDNAHNLSAEYIKSLANMPEKQRKRFYEGAFVDQIDGALWTYELLERQRVEMSDITDEKRARVVVAVDPSGASGEDENADDIGIVVAAKGRDDHAYVLDDRSILAGPGGSKGWAAKAVQAYKDYRADCIVAERNFGGEMVRTVIQAVDHRVPVKLVTASRGKAVRAQPVATLYEAGTVHHVGRFSKMEEQMCAFNSAGYSGANSPDNADAAVWAITELMLGEEEVPSGQVSRYTSRYR